MDSKPLTFDFNKFNKCVQFCRWYEEDIYVVPFWNLTNGEEVDEEEGEPAGLQVKEKKRTYYMASGWPNINYDSKMYANN